VAGRDFDDGGAVCAARGAGFGTFADASDNA